VTGLHRLGRWAGVSLMLVVKGGLPMLSSLFPRLALVCVSLTWVLAPRLQAADYTYSGGTGGTWDETATGWTGASGTPWDSTAGAGNTATFSTGTPVNVSGNVFTNGITVSATTTLQSTGVVNFAGTSPTLAANAQFNLFSSIAGSFTKTGTSELYIGGDNSSTLANATVTLSAGRTRGYQGSTVTGKELGPASTTIDIQSGARLRWFQRQNDALTAYPATARIAGNGSAEGAFNNDGNAGANRIFWSGPVILAADATITAQNSGTYTFGGAFTEETASTLTFSLNAGTTDVSSSMTVTGLTKSGNGTLAFGPAATLSVGTLTTSGGSLTFDPATNVSVANWALNAGTLPVTRTGIINAGNTITFGSSGTLGQTGSDATDYSGQFATSAGQTFRINTGSNNIEWAAGLVSSGGSIVKSGSGTLTLSGDNSGLGGVGTSLNFGSTNANAGYLVPTTNNAFGSLAAINATGGNAGVSGINLAGGLTFSTPLTTWGRDNATTVGYILRNVSGDNAWNGSITITGGGGGYGLVSTAGTLTIGGNVTSTVTGLASARVLSVAGDGDTLISGAVVKGGTASGSQDLAISKNGAGTLTLSGTNDYGGTTTISAGRMLFNGDSSLATGAITVNGGTLGGTGSVGGAVTVNAGGSLAPGASIESFATGAASLVDGSIFAYEIDSSAAASVGADLLLVNGGFDLAGGVALSLADVAGTPVAVTPGTTFTMVNYTGSWNSGLFSVGGTPLADGGTFTAGLNTWQIAYSASSGGVNFPGEQVAGGFVNLTAVPEPASLAAALAATGFLMAAIRRSTRGVPPGKNRQP
jgi:autotransporter-associated beta strand protein